MTGVSLGSLRPAGLDSVAKAYDQRGLYYRRYWDRETNLMRPSRVMALSSRPSTPLQPAHEKSDYTGAMPISGASTLPTIWRASSSSWAVVVLERNLDTSSPRPPHRWS